MRKNMNLGVGEGEEEEVEWPERRTTYVKNTAGLEKLIKVDIILACVVGIHSYQPRHTSA